MKITKNRGMYLETLINNTCMYCSQNNIAYIEKRFLPTKIKRKNSNNEIIANVYEKSKTDYFGVYKGHYLDFEAKQTNNDYLPKNNIKNYQIDHMKKIYEANGITFFVIYFARYNKFFLIEYLKFEKYLIDKNIKYEWCQKNGYELDVIFPGYLNIIDILEKHLI